MTLNELRDRCHALAREKGWHDKGRRPFGEVMMLVVCEAAEAMEEHRCGRDEVWFGPDGKPEGKPIELADMIIRILDEAGAAGIDMDSALELKMAYNATRPYRHGGKLA